MVQTVLRIRLDLAEVCDAQETFFFNAIFFGDGFENAIFFFATLLA